MTLLFARASAASIGAAAVFLTCGSSAEIGRVPPKAAAVSQATTPAPYRTLERLIGEWDTGPASAPPDFVQRFSWGTDRAYVVFRTMLIADGGEHLHFEGPILWNGASRRFDYLFAIEPGSGELAQESGEIYEGDDGAIIRDVTLTRADGSVARFRQTFRLIGSDRFETSLMRHAAGAWTPTFPRSDQLIMTRRR